MIIYQIRSSWHTENISIQELTVDRVTEQSYFFGNRRRALKAEYDCCYSNLSDAANALLDLHLSRLRAAADTLHKAEMLVESIKSQYKSVLTAH